MKQLSVTLKLILTLLILTVVLVVIIDRLNRRNFEQLTTQSSDARLNDELGIIVQRFEEQEQLIMTRAQTISGAQLLVQAVSTKNKVFVATGMGNIIKTIPVDDLEILAADGERLYTLNPIDEAQDVSEKEALLQRAIDDGTVVSGIVLKDGNAEHPTYFLVAAAPFVDAQGRIVGAVLIGNNFDDDLVKTLNFERENIHLGVVYREHLIAVHIEHEEDAIADSSRLEVDGIDLDTAQIEKAQTGKNIIDKKLYENGEGSYRLVYVPIQFGTDQAVGVILMNVSADFELQNNFARNTNLNALFSEIVAVIVLTFAVRYIVTTPLHQMKTIAGNVSRGDYSQQMAVRSEDEIGILAQTFNQLTQAVQKREQELRDVNAHLEAQVQERTATLRDANKQLEAREVYLNNIFANTSDALLVVNADTLQIDDANEKAAELTGYSKTELHQKTLYTLHEHQPEALQKFLANLIKEHSATTDRLSWQRSDTIKLDLEISASTVELEKPSLILAVRDITERKIFEAQLQSQNEALVIANRDLAIARREALELVRLKTQFLATMSHELRTPLNAIIGYSEIQLAGMTGEMTEEQTDYQQRILTNSEHLLNLINDVLDLSKIEAGRVELQEDEILVQEFAGAIFFQMQGLAQKKGLELTLEIDKQMPPSVVGDNKRMKQILINLLSNAIKFTEKGSVRLLMSIQQENQWQIQVIDTGVGIPKHAHDLIFDEFRQVDSSSTRQYGGTGLGLAIVKKLLIMMGGKIELTSEVGQGSTFTITLPLVLKTPV